MGRGVRTIIKIDEDKCNGCGLCVPACAEGAIAIIDGKARLVSETYCDGLGACLGECPQGAISMEERPAEAFDEAAAAAHVAQARRPAGGCPGAAMQSLLDAGLASGSRPGAADEKAASDAPPPSRLGHWPVQLHLTPPNAPFLIGADLLICADCAPFTIPDFHERYLDGRAVVVGCPKLDDIEAYRVKIGEILRQAKPRRITVLRMEVPCCGALAEMVKAQALLAPSTTLEIHTAGIRGGITREVIT